MAEGDSIVRVTRRLHRLVAGSTVVRCELRVPRLALVDLRGRRLLGVQPRGKHLLMRFGVPVTRSPHADVPLTLHSHLRMQGRWRVVDPGRRPGGRAHERRVLLRLDDGRVLLGERLPVLDLVPTSEEHRVVGHLGPDVLGADWDADEAVRRLAVQGDRSLHEALLDQRCIAGPGNLYAVECAFLAGVHPSCPVRDVDLARVVAVVHDTMQRQLALGHQATTGRRRRGHDHWVYGRAGRACHRCATAVCFAAGRGVRARPMWWCPRCQPSA